MVKMSLKPQTSQAGGIQAPPGGLPCPSAGSAPLERLAFGGPAGLLWPDVLRPSGALWPSGLFLPSIRDGGGVTFCAAAPPSSKQKEKKQERENSESARRRGNRFSNLVDGPQSAGWLMPLVLELVPLPALLRGRGQVAPLAKMKFLLARRAAFLQLGEPAERGASELWWLLFSLYRWAPDTQERPERLQGPPSPESAGSYWRKPHVRTHGSLATRSYHKAMSLSRTNARMAPQGHRVQSGTSRG